MQCDEGGPWWEVLARNIHYCVVQTHIDKLKMKDHNWGYAPPHIPHSKNTHFEHKVVFHGSMTTHAMLHGDCNIMQHEVLNHL